MKVLGPPMSGSLAGVTAAVGGASQVLRKKSVPVQPIRSSSASFSRPTLGFLAQQWAKLTPAQQRAWDTQGKSTTRTDSLGQSHTLSGFQQFMSISLNLENSGVGFAPDPPASLGVFVEGMPVLVATHAPLVTVQCQGAGSSSDATLLEFSKPVSNGVTNPKNYYILAVLGGDDANVNDFTVPYVLRFGAPTQGTKIFVRAVPISEFGIKGKGFTAATVVA